MERSNNKMIGYGLGVVMLVIGALVGYGIGKGSMNKNSSTASSQVPTSSSKAADLRANLVTLGVQHMSLTDQAIDGALDKGPNATQFAAALYQNGNDIGTAVGSVYGTSAQSTFDAVWKLHLDEFVKYAVADAGGDAAGKTAALNAIQTGYTKPLSQYLAKANPNIDEATLESALGDHVNMTAAIIDAHVQGKYADEATQLTAANQHIEGIFSSLAGAIVKQYPAKF